MTISKLDVGIIGAGTMGAQIASLFAFCGHSVIVFDCTPPDDLNSRIRKSFRFLKRNEAMRPFAAEKEGNIQVVDRIEEIRNAPFIMECISEHLELKKSVLQHVDKITESNALIATNTSSLSVTDLSSSLKHRDRFLGAHFFNPLHAVPLVELSKTTFTSAQRLATATALLAELGRVVVPVMDSPGFIVNRLLFLLIAEAARMVDENVAEPKQIDFAMKAGANFPMGPLEIADIIGLDVCESILKNLYARTGDAVYAVPDSLAIRVSNGQLGRKTGAGFYQRKQL